MKNTKVFISYCHKDVAEEWIEKLVEILGQNGIESIVDIYDLYLGQDLNYFMERIKKVDKVLVLIGREYKEKANKRKGGVGVETQIISNDVYNNLEQTKLIPIVINRDEEGNAYLPYYLESRLYIDFSNNKLFEENIDKLVRQINMLPPKEKPQVMNKDKSEKIVEGYLEDLWDLEMSIDNCRNKGCLDIQEIKHFLDVADRYVKEIKESKEISQSKKMSLLDRLEYFKNNVQDILSRK